MVRTAVLFFAYRTPATPKPAQTARPASATTSGMLPSPPALSSPLLVVVVDFAAAASQLPVGGAPAVDTDSALAAVSGVDIEVPLNDMVVAVVVVVTVAVTVTVSVVVVVVVVVDVVVVVLVLVLCSRTKTRMWWS